MEILGLSCDRDRIFSLALHNLPLLTEAFKKIPILNGVSFRNLAIAPSQNCAPNRQNKISRLKFESLFKRQGASRSFRIRLQMT